MIPANEMELFSQLRAHPRFMEWLLDKEQELVAVLKANHSHVTLHQAQGAAQFIDGMKKMLVAANKDTRAPKMR